MSIINATPAGDRWIKPFNFPPGHWKKQLPAKLLRLAERGRLSELQAVIAKSPSLLNHRGPHGRTFLFEAVRRNREEVTNWLLEQGANIELTGCYNSESLVQLNPLCAARYYKHPTLEKLLLSRGASNDIFRSAFHGDLQQVESTLEKDIDLLNAEDPHDEIYFVPLISFAVAGRQSSLMRNLIDRGAELRQYSFQLLFIGAHVEEAENLKVLIEHGVSANDADASLWMASDKLEILELLLSSGLSANQRPYRGLHPLMYACRADKSQSTDRIRFLIEQGAEIDAIGPQGRTALHYAARSGNVPMCKLLLEANADPSHVTEQGQTALEIARSTNKIEVVELLEKH